MIGFVGVGLLCVMLDWVGDGSFVGEKDCDNQNGTLFFFLVKMDQF